MAALITDPVDSHGMWLHQDLVPELNFAVVRDSSVRRQAPGEMRPSTAAERFAGLHRHKVFECNEIRIPAVAMDSSTRRVPVLV